MQGRKELLLDNKVWYMKQMNPGQGVKERLYEIPPERDICFSGWNEASVPGDVYSDLQRAGAIEDPYIGRNMVKSAWVQYYEWWYVCRFNGPKEYENMDLQLVLEGVDYSYEIWLNNHYLGSHEGMYSRGKFDVTGLVRTYLDEDNSSECDNLLWIKLDVAPQSLYNIAGLHHTFSGDYLPGFVPVGIWRSVKIIGSSNARLEDIKIESKLDLLDDSDAVELKDENICKLAHVLVDIPIEVKYGEYLERKIVTKIYTDGFLDVKEDNVYLHPGSNSHSVTFDIHNPKLWWPWDMGGQPLYYVNVSIYENDILLDEKTERFGIRQIDMKMNPGFTEAEAENPWTFVINGKSFFLRSACWGGPPSFLYGRNSLKKYQKLLKYAKEANLNNLRMFGWHPPEVKEFYDICDEIGITVWTNFPLSSQVLRDDDVYVGKVLAESTEIIKQRRNHPSNIFWMGGEEVFFSEAQVRSHNRRMMELVGKCVKENTDIPYADASMMSSPPGIRLGYKTKETLHANGHYYAAGATLMEDYFPKMDCCIIPELCGASAPSVESLKKFIPKDELWPIGVSWGYLMANVDILKAINVEVFGDDRFQSLEEFVNATQIAQGEVYKFAIETIRRKKPHISGVSLCHFITNRPLIKWEIIDYYGNKKLCYDFVKKGFEPLLLSIQYEKRRWLPNEKFNGDLWVVNDTYNEYNDVTYVVKIFDKDNKLVHEENKVISITKNSSEKFFSTSKVIEGKIGEYFIITLELIKDGSIITTNDYKLLIDDQEKARERSRECYRVHREKTLKYGKTLYRDVKEQMELD